MEWTPERVREAAAEWVRVPDEARELRSRPGPRATLVLVHGKADTSAPIVRRAGFRAYGQ